jgi:hypothetical protein
VFPAIEATTPAHGTAYDTDPAATIKAFETLLSLTSLRMVRTAA